MTKRQHRPGILSCAVWLNENSFWDSISINLMELHRLGRDRLVFHRFDSAVSMANCLKLGLD